MRVAKILRGIMRVARSMEDRQAAHQLLRNANELFRGYFRPAATRPWLRQLAGISASPPLAEGDPGVDLDGIGDVLAAITEALPDKDSELAGWLRDFAKDVELDPKNGDCTQELLGLLGVAKARELTADSWLSEINLLEHWLSLETWRRRKVIVDQVIDSAGLMPKDAATGFLNLVSELLDALFQPLFSDPFLRRLTKSGRGAPPAGRVGGRGRLTTDATLSRVCDTLSSHDLSQLAGSLRLEFANSGTLADTIAEIRRYVQWDFETKEGVQERASHLLELINGLRDSLREEAFGIRHRAKDEAWRKKFEEKERARKNRQRAVGVGESAARRFGAVLGALGLLSFAADLSLVELQQNVAQWIEAYHAYVRVIIDPILSFFGGAIVRFAEFLINLRVEFPRWLLDALVWIRDLRPPYWLNDYFGLAFIYSFAIVRSDVFRDYAARSFSTALGSLRDAGILWFTWRAIVLVATLMTLVLLPIAIASALLPVFVALSPIVCMYALTKVLSGNVGKAAPTDLLAIYDSMAETFAWFVLLLALNFVLIRLGLPTSP